MKVVYESVERHLHRVVEHAERIGRVIEYIELDPMEWHEFMTLFPSDSRLGDRCHTYLGVSVRKGSFR